MTLYRWALKLGYLGWEYSGFQRQPNRRTIEDIVIKVLQEEGAFDSPKNARYGFASRTDKEVSAIGQVISFNSETSKIILSKINKELPEDIWIFGYKLVDFDFNPRKDTLEKHYRYITIYDGDVTTLKDIATRFEGTHNFRNLSKRDRKKSESTVRNIQKIEVKKIQSNLVAIDFFGKSFLWEQIRRIVRVILDVSKKIIDIEKVDDILEGKKVMNIQPMPGRGLILMNVMYGFDFNYDKNIIKRINKSITEIIYKYYTHYGVAEAIKEKIKREITRFL